MLLSKYRTFPAAFALFLAVLPAFFPASASASASLKSETERLAGEIVAGARANGTGRIAVSVFSAIGGADAAETQVIVEKICAGLAAHGEERPAAQDPRPGANAETLRAAFSADALLTGTVFKTGGNIKIMARLTDIRTGLVLLTAKAEYGDGAKGAAPVSMEIPGFPGPYPWWDSGAVPPADLRDAVSGQADSSCSDRKLRIRKLNAELADAKARYWAAKLKAPSFGLRGLRRNPGIEISDPKVRGGFYKLLAGYFGAVEPAPNAPERLTAVLDLMQEETRFLIECGLQ